LSVVAVELEMVLGVTFRNSGHTRRRTRR